jgi:hypothetical protein
VSAARHLCSTAGQACGPARGIRSPGDLRRRRHLVDDPSGGGSGTCASWPQLRIVVVMATSQARASCRGGRYPPDRTIPSLRPTAGSFSKIVCVRLWPHLVGGSGLGALGDDCSRVCDRLQARSWPGGCGCAFWHVARACRSSHDTEPTESASPQMVPAAAPVASCSVAMATCVTCRVTLGGWPCCVVSPWRNHLPVPACQSGVPATRKALMHTIYARAWHIVNCCGVRTGQSLWRWLLCFTMAWRSAVRHKYVLGWDPVAPGPCVF